MCVNSYRLIKLKQDSHELVGLDCSTSFYKFKLTKELVAGDARVAETGGAFGGSATRAHSP